MRSFGKEDKSSTCPLRHQDNLVRRRRYEEDSRRKVKSDANKIRINVVLKSDGLSVDQMDRQEKRVNRCRRHVFSKRI